MPSLDRIVDVQAILRLSGVRATGFNRALILTGDTFGPELTRFYAGVTSLQAAWATNLAARVAGDALFSQELTPDGVRVGRLTVPPAQVLDIIVSSTVASTLYSLTVDDTVVEYTSDSAPTSAQDEVVTGLKAAIDAESISGLTTSLAGTAGSKTLRLTWAAGQRGWASLKGTSGLDWGPHGKQLLAIEALTDDPATSAADQLAAIKREKNDWFWLINPFPGKDITTELAAWCLANKKILIQADPTSAIATTTPGSGTDIAATLKTASSRGAAILYHPEMNYMADAAWVGGTPGEPGTYTMMFRTLQGVPVVGIDDTHEENILGKYANAYLDNGIILTEEGTLADGTYIDAYVTALALEARLQAANARHLKEHQPFKVGSSDRDYQGIWGSSKVVFDAMTGPGRAFERYQMTLKTKAQQDPDDTAVRLVDIGEYEAIYNTPTHKIRLHGVIRE